MKLILTLTMLLLAVGVIGAYALDAPTEEAEVTKAVISSAPVCGGQCGPSNGYCGNPTCGARTGGGCGCNG